MLMKFVPKEQFDGIHNELIAEAAKVTMNALQ